MEWTTVTRSCCGDFFVPGRERLGGLGPDLDASDARLSTFGSAHVHDFGTAWYSDTNTVARLDDVFTWIEYLVGITPKWRFIEPHLRYPLGDANEANALCTIETDPQPCSLSGLGEGNPLRWVTLLLGLARRGRYGEAVELDVLDLVPGVVRHLIARDGGRCGGGRGLRRHVVDGAADGEREDDEEG